MTKVSALSKNFYLMMLASIGVLATWFALMSSGSCFGAWFYQPKMPTSLIRKDE